MRVDANTFEAVTDENEALSEVKVLAYERVVDRSCVLEI